MSAPPNQTEPTKTTKCPFCGHFVFFVRDGEIVGFVVFGEYRETVEIVDFVGNVGQTPLSVSPPCGRLASSPEGGAKRTAVKPGERVVRQSRREVRLTTTWPTPTGVLLAPPVGELSAKLTERATGRRSVNGEGNRPARLRGELPHKLPLVEPAEMW